LSGAEEVQNQLTELLKSDPAAPPPEQEQNREEEQVETAKIPSF